jgi:surface polysaccharide O-acyltransferase-like enzyme
VVDLARIGVPFFLIVSGYFLFTSSNIELGHKLKKNIPNLLSIILKVSLFYAILRFLKHYYFGIDISSQKFNLFSFLVANDEKFTEHLWYLFAYLYVLIILWFANKFNKINILLSFLPLFIIIYFVLSIWSYNYTIRDFLFLLENNWFVIALPFVILGFVVKKYFILFDKLKSNNLIYMIFILIVFVFLEHYAFKQIIGKGPGIFSSTYLSILFFLFCALNFTIISPNIDSFFAKLGREHSLNIYLYHIMTREILFLCGISNQWNNTFVVFLVTLFLSIVYKKIVKHNFKV